MTGIGTIINVITVLVGGVLGTLMGARLPERVRETIMHGLGLLTLVIGVQLSIHIPSQHFMETLIHWVLPSA